MNFVIGLFHDDAFPTQEYYTEYLADCEEYELRDSLNASIMHERSWEEFTRNTIYCTKYSIGDDDASRAEIYRNGISIDDYASAGEVWRDVYHKLYIDSRDKLGAVQDSLLNLSDSTSAIDRDEFARLVVSFVQDIPYQYVVPDGCEEKVGPCNANVNFGIYSPVEFLYHLKGDCDTRTVLLFTLLKNFGYSPVIVNSMQYRHSMLALDIPSAGDDFIHKGRRYAYWETTNVGWQPGMLPPEMNNKAYWSVALDYEY